MYFFPSKPSSVSKGSLRGVLLLPKGGHRWCQHSLGHRISLRCPPPGSDVPPAWRTLTPDRRQNRIHNERVVWPKRKQVGWRSGHSVTHHKSRSSNDHLPDVAKIAFQTLFSSIPGLRVLHLVRSRGFSVADGFSACPAPKKRGENT